MIFFPDSLLLLGKDSPSIYSTLHSTVCNTDLHMVTSTPSHGVLLTLCSSSCIFHPPSPECWKLKHYTSFRLHHGLRVLYPLRSLPVILRSHILMPQRFVWEKNFSLKLFDDYCLYLYVLTDSVISEKNLQYYKTFYNSSRIYFVLPLSGFMWLIFTCNTSFSCCNS